MLEVDERFEGGGVICNLKKSFSILAAFLAGGLAGRCYPGAKVFWAPLVTGRYISSWASFGTLSAVLAVSLNTPISATISFSSAILILSAILFLDHIMFTSAILFLSSILLSSAIRFSFRFCGASPDFVCVASIPGFSIADYFISVVATGSPIIFICSCVAVVWSFVAMAVLANVLTLIMTISILIPTTLGFLRTTRRAIQRTVVIS